MAKTGALKPRILPIDLLMKEHRLIERFINLLKKETDRMVQTEQVNSDLIIAAVDFLRTYADRCHHGKEEGILFKALAEKRLSVADRRVMRELIAEHVYARKKVNNLEKAKESYVKSEAGSLKDIVQLVIDLIEFYPMHINREDKQFFYSSTEYFSRQEQEEMLQEFWDFDRNLVHAKYQQITERMENNSSR